MSPGRPGFEVWTFELNGLNIEAWQIPSIGVFAADTDFANSGEVIHVIFFNFGRGEVGDGGIEDLLLNLVTANFDRQSDGSESAAAIPAQSEVNSQPRSACFESEEAGSLGEFRSQGSDEQFAGVLWL